jgi:hypothetical protein
MGFLQFAPKIGEGDMARLETDQEFPFCVLPAEPWDGSTFFGQLPSNSNSSETPVVGAYTRHPAGFTKSEFFEFFYRIKNYDMSFSLTDKFWQWDSVDSEWKIIPDSGLTVSGHIDSSDKSDVNNFSPSEDENASYRFFFLNNDVDGEKATLNFGTPGTKMVRSEADLSCPQSFPRFTFRQETGVVAESSGAILSVPVFPTVYFCEGLYYPRVSLSVGVALPPDFLFTVATMRSQAAPNFVAGGTFVRGGVTINLIQATNPFYYFGKEIPIIQGTGAPSGTPDPPEDDFFYDVVWTGEDLSISIQLSAESGYWPYKDADGNPLYDEDTGEPV